MIEPQALNFNMTISGSYSTDDELDRLTRQLLMKLEELDVEPVRLETSDSVPVGTKGLDSMTAGAIAMSVLPAMLPKVLEFLQSWKQQGRGRTIKFKGK
jgi:hypothetical protein